MEVEVRMGFKIDNEGEDDCFGKVLRVIKRGSLYMGGKV